MPGTNRTGKTLSAIPLIPPARFGGTLGSLPGAVLGAVLGAFLGAFLGALLPPAPALANPDVTASTRAPADESATPATSAATGAATPAHAAFERFQALAGDWRGKSTQGWDDRVTWEVIAGGSAVMETSLFDAHPDQTMLTVVHLDGDRLMLTHYCVAGNQPRMVAQAFEDGGRIIRFGFLDATNLDSPGDGHMHSAVFRFSDDGHYTSQWSFHRDGKEAWMEEIAMERAAGAGAPAGVDSGVGSGLDSSTRSRAGSRAGS